MSLWGRVFAAGYDRLMASSERGGLAAKRTVLLGEATGRVLEIGAGTGLNLARYGDGIQELVLTEPEEPMAKRLEGKLRKSGLDARVVRAPAEQLPFEEGAFDCVVSTLVLCTVPDPAATLAELRRVLRADGRLLFLEHVRSEDPKLAGWQDRLRPLWARFGQGCQCNRTTLSNIEGAGFRVEQLEHDRVPKAPFWVRPLIVGRAVSPA
jgi:ubiquinone/menaquinone biosynthesis C-methylase UbiE